MSEVNSEFVRRGFWVNVDQGPIMGQTITTDTRTGVIVVALLAVLSSLGTAHLWHLLLFCHHQYRATGEPRDAFFRQQQVTIRALPTPSTMLADSIKLWWAWRSRAHSVFSRSVIQGLMASLFAMISLATSISSSFVATNANVEVLVSSTHCGGIGDISHYRTKVYEAAETYARECYQQNQTNTPARCDNIFTQSRLRLNTSYVGCPFAPSMCEQNAKHAVALDSGLLDVNDIFGLNLGPNDRLQFRKRSTCAVLPTEGHTTIIKAKDFPLKIRARDLTITDEELVLHHYGENPGLGIWKNVTQVHSLLDANISQTYNVLGKSILNAPSLFGRLSRQTVVLPEMRRDDADVVILAVFKYATEYHQPVDDPVFAAHRNVSRLAAAGKGSEIVNIYHSDHSATWIGCASQYQFCPNQQCGKLGSLPGNLSEVFPQATDLQLAVMDLIVNSSVLFDLSSNKKVQAQSLRLNSGTIPSLPNNQWIVELQAWESFVWAALQTSIADYAIGPAVRSSLVEGNVTRPATSAQNKLCGIQRMRKAGGFVNINVFGLSFIIALSCFFMILDISLLKFLIFYANVRKALNPRVDRWIQDGALQLQRRVYQANRIGTWTKLDDEIPVTFQKEFFRDLTNSPNLKPVANSASLQKLDVRRESASSSEVIGTIERKNMLESEV